MWQGLYKTVATFIKALPHMTNVLVLMLLCMTIFSLLGMQFFGGKLGERGEGPRRNFDYFGDAMTSVFIILTGTW